MSTPAPPLDVDALWGKMRPDSQGLVPCVVQDVKSRRVLMMAWVSRAALAQALETGWATFWSRSRAAIWEKGSTSGHRQRLLHVRLDCDGDTLIYMVEPLGPACHEGYDTCFTWRRVGNGWKRDPEPVEYTAPRGTPLVAELRDLVEGSSPPEPAASSRPNVRDLRVGGVVEARAHQLANHLQLRQKDRVLAAAAELWIETLRSLRTLGLDARDIRALLDGGVPTAPAEPASVSTGDAEVDSEGSQR